MLGAYKIVTLFCIRICGFKLFPSETGAVGRFLTLSAVAAFTCVSLSFSFPHSYSIPSIGCDARWGIAGMGRQPIGKVFFP